MGEGEGLTSLSAGQVRTRSTFGQNDSFWPFWPNLAEMARFGRLWYRVVRSGDNSIPQAGMSGGLGAPSARLQLASRATANSPSVEGFGDSGASRRGEDSSGDLRPRLRGNATLHWPRIRSAKPKILRIFGFYRPKASDLARFARTFSFYVSHFVWNFWSGFMAQAHF